MEKKFINALVLAGPTSSGKTKVAAAILNRYQGELINADKIYLFKNVRIGSGILDTYSQIRGSLHLFEVLETMSPVWNVDHYIKMADSCVADILERGKLPIIEGCSVEYNIGLIRSNQNIRRDFRYIPVGLKWYSRMNLEDKVRKRVDGMINNGLVEEGMGLIQAGFRWSYPITRSVVYEPLMEFLEGLFDFKIAKEKIVRGIIDLAMKELDALEKEKEIIWIAHDENDEKSFKNTIDKIDNYIKEYCYGYSSAPT